MHVHATVAGVEILVVGVEMHARARATGKATPAAIYSYSRNALPVLVRDGSGLDLLALNLRCGRGRARGPPRCLELYRPGRSGLHRLRISTI